MTIVPSSSFNPIDLVIEGIQFPELVKLIPKIYIWKKKGR